MSYHTHTACHLLRPVTPSHRTPEGEDAYYRGHSSTTPLPLSRVIAALAALRRALPAVHTAHSTVPALK